MYVGVLSNGGEQVFRSPTRGWRSQQGQRPGYSQDEILLLHVEELALPGFANDDHVELTSIAWGDILRALCTCYFQDHLRDGHRVRDDRPNARTLALHLS